MTNALILLDFLIKLGDRFTAGMAVLRKAEAEGRDVTPEELDAASAEYDAKSAALKDRLTSPDG